MGSIETCNGRCIGKGIKSIGKEYDGGSISPYSLGYKYCVVCEFYFETVLSRCNCCNQRLRCKPVHTTAKKKKRRKTKTNIFRID